MANDRFDRLDGKIDNLDARLDLLEKILERNTQSLEDHIRRTNILEDYVKHEIHPIKSHVTAVKYGIQGVMWLGSIVAGLAGFLLILSELGIFKLPIL